MYIFGLTYETVLQRFTNKVAHFFISYLKGVPILHNLKLDIPRRCTLDILSTTPGYAAGAKTTLGATLYIENMFPEVFWRNRLHKREC